MAGVLAGIVHRRGPKIADAERWSDPSFQDDRSKFDSAVWCSHIEWLPLHADELSTWFMHNHCFSCKVEVRGASNRGPGPRRAQVLRRANTEIIHRRYFSDKLDLLVNA